MERVMTNDEIMSTFVREDDIYNVIGKLKSHIQTEIDTSPRQDKALYRQQVFIKLNTIFRRQIQLTEQEAIQFYESNQYFLNERINLFYDILDRVNTDINVAYIPDKLTLCAFFRISAETWDDFIVHFAIKENIRKLFLSLEEFVISMTTTGVEIGQLKDSALNRMRLKGKFGGNNIEYHEVARPTNNGFITVQDQAQEANSIVNKYDFEKLENKN